MRKVVITGMGMCTPLGYGVGHGWSQLINSKSGVIKWSKKIFKLINKIILHQNIESSVRRHKDVLLYYTKKNKI